MTRITILTILCAASFYAGYTQPSRTEILHEVELRKEYVPIAACKPITALKTPAFYGAQMQLAAAIPASALQPKKRKN